MDEERLSRRIKDETGNRYGRLYVVKYCGKDNSYAAQFLCKCDCGKDVIATGSNLRKGHTKSCGCFQKDIARKNIKRYVSGDDFVPPSNKKHGHRKDRIYKEWCLIKQRCYNRNRDHSDRYYYRGITMCDEWKDSFVSFYNWAVSNGYRDDLFIDRIDNDKGYSPDNCRWATRKQQMLNREVTVYIEHNGEKKTLVEWCEKFGIKYKTAWQRYKKGLCFDSIFKTVNKKCCTL